MVNCFISLRRQNANLRYIYKESHHDFYIFNDRKTYLNFQIYLLFCLKVERRYSDFAAMYELLVLRYRCRLIPKLPPKNIGSMIVGVKSGLVGERRRALKRWLLILLNHPIVSLDPVVQVPYNVLSKKFMKGFFCS